MRSWAETRGKYRLANFDATISLQNQEHPKYSDGFESREFQVRVRAPLTRGARGGMLRTHTTVGRGHRREG